VTEIVDLLKSFLDFLVQLVIQILFLFDALLLNLSYNFISIIIFGVGGGRLLGT